MEGNEGGDEKKEGRKKGRGRNVLGVQLFLRFIRRLDLKVDHLFGKEKKEGRKGAKGAKEGT
jgi:hypothetical protein